MLLITINLCILLPIFASSSNQGRGNNLSDEENSTHLSFNDLKVKMDSEYLKAHPAIFHNQQFIDTFKDLALKDAGRAAGLIKSLSETHIKKIGHNFFSNIVGIEEFIKVIENDPLFSFDNFSCEALLSIDENLAHRLKHKINFSNADRFAANAFSKFSYDDFRHIGILGLNRFQIPHLSSIFLNTDSVKDKHYFARAACSDIFPVISEKYRKSPSDLIWAISPDQWKVIDPACFSLLDDEAIVQVSLQGLKSFTDEQISNLPEKTLLSLTFRTISKIGIDSGAELKALTGMVAKLSMEQLDGIKVRLPNFRYPFYQLKIFEMVICVVSTIVCIVASVILILTALYHKPEKIAAVNVEKDGKE